MKGGDEAQSRSIKGGEENRPGCIVEGSKTDRAGETEVTEE